MKGSPIQRVDQGLRHTLPFVITLLLVFMAATPTHLPGFTPIMPQLPLIGVYYWAIFRPDLLRPWTAFALGAISDIVAGTPLGVSSLTFLAVQGFCESQRRFFLGKSFLVAWWGFGLVCAGALAIEWVGGCLVMLRLLAPGGLLFQYLMTVMLYPLIGWAFIRVQLAILRHG